ncbi:hypothetical protein N0V88_004156 [Collariella sp. IMI 366227]|nr:hypothetical protein N0V88_004156 [Collariella sp. IMI 366227]
MAPSIEQVAALVKREDGCGSGAYRANNGLCYSYSGWYWWGRWVLAGLAVLFFFLVLALLFRNSRRRRRHGARPMYGTGWMAPPPPYQPPPPQYAQQDPNGGYYPPPQQQQQQQQDPNGGYKYGQGDGYYAGNQEGIQLQQPSHAYHRDTGTEYAPPPGPPPTHNK